MALNPSKRHNYHDFGWLYCHWLKLDCTLLYKNMLVHKSVLKRLLIHLCCKAVLIHPLNQHILILKRNEKMNLTIDHRNQLPASRSMQSPNFDGRNQSAWSQRIHHRPSQATYRVAATIGQERSRSAQWALLNLQQKRGCRCTGSGKSSERKI